MRRYNPKEIEPKWQAVWEESKIYRAAEDKSKPKRYILEYFPYPSGAAMHVGHVRNYTMGDALSRFARMNGFNVLHPMGWDAFGLPAENYAIKTGISPQKAVAQNVEHFKQQLMQMGLGYDWSREINSTDPSYYKWTQWLFLLLYKRGLAYQKESLQWWCPNDKTVLANEQVENGRCWRCGHLVEKKALKQWFFKITEYADRLDKDLEKLNWSNAIKTMQHNWIGKSGGAEIDFSVEGHKDKIKVFTTRPDTIFGATFLVVAPEHEILNKLSINNEVKNYILSAERKSEIDRMETEREKTGVFSGFYAINPANDEKIPIWVADYVLPGYGTGAIMAVPAHDARDHEFARKFKLPIRPVIAQVFGPELDNPKAVEGVVVIGYDPKTNKFLSLNNEGEAWLVGGGREADETFGEAATRELEEESGYKAKQLIELGDPIYSFYFNPIKQRNTQSLGYNYLAIIDSADQGKTRQEAHENFEILWSDWAALYARIEKTSRNRDADHWLEALNRARLAASHLDEPDWQFPVFEGEGQLINSAKYDGLSSAVARDQIVKDLSGFDFANDAKVETFVNPETGEEELVFTDVGDGAPKPNQPFEERQAVEVLVKHWKEDKYIGLKWKKIDWETIITGGIEKGQTAEEAAIAEIRQETGYQNPVLKKKFGVSHAKFYHGPKKVNRFAHFQVLYFELADGEHKGISDEEKEIHEVVWLSREEMDKFRLPDSQRYMWNLFQGRGGVAKEKVNYKIRDWLISRQRYWGAPTPIIHCEKCGAVPVPDKDLPVELPPMKSYEPSGDGQSPLARVPEFVNVNCPKCGEPAERETDTMDGFACSSWYFLRFADPHNDQEPFAKDKAEFWLPVDDYIGGAEHAVMHLLYARFWTKVMFDEGLIKFDEPFTTLRNQGMILAPDGQKMSKSKGNTIEPDGLIEQGYGADSIRLMELFIGPWDQAASWSIEGIGGTFRFLQRVWTLAHERYETNTPNNTNTEREILAVSNSTIKKVTEDIEKLNFNTAVAALMGFTNELYKIKGRDNFAAVKAWDFALKTLVQLLAPFAPHISEELWQLLKNKNLVTEDSVHRSGWPKWDEDYIQKDTVILAVQINGKVRDEMELPLPITEEYAIRAAREKVVARLKGKKVIKAIYVPGRLVSFVVE